MTNTGNMEKTVHQGHNLKRFREMLGVKQDALALDLGAQWSQKRISLLEQKEVIDPELLEQIADILKVPAEAIRNFDEEQAIINIQHNYEGSNNQGPNLIFKSTINPIEGLVEALNENKRLYEALLKAEREKITLLEQMLKSK